MHNPTIAAVATAKGMGGVGVVRISGPTALEIGLQVSKNRQVEARKVLYTKFYSADHKVIDIGLLLYFQRPNSFTGEDVVELQGHGGPVVLDCLLNRVLELGAILARPGEFTERAFLNGKIDLTQAEAVASLIEAESEAAVKAAARSLQGEFSKKIEIIVEELIGLRKYIEAGIDFPEDEIDLLAEAKVVEAITFIRKELSALLQQTKQGVLLNDGVKIVLIGGVNVGKSSLLNLLAEEDAAIVTHIPGTTRDLIKVKTLLNGVKAEIIDTAGLRETNDIVEKEGVRRSYEVLRQADLVLIVVDSEDVFLMEQIAQKIECKKIIIKNKIDLLKQSADIAFEHELPVIRMSAKTKEGKNLLLKEIKKQLGLDFADSVFIARRRHVQALVCAQELLGRSGVYLQEHGNDEVFAEELRLVHNALLEITGQFSANDLLDRIFSEFCIGK